MWSLTFELGWAEFWFDMQIMETSVCNLVPCHVIAKHSEIVGVINHFTNVNFCSPQSFVGAKNWKSGELIRQNVTEQHYFAPREAWNWQKFVLVKWRIRRARLFNGLVTTLYGLVWLQIYVQTFKLVPNHTKVSRVDWLGNLMTSLYYMFLFSFFLLNYDVAVH